MAYSEFRNQQNKTQQLRLEVLPDRITNRTDAQPAYLARAWQDEVLWRPSPVRIGRGDHPLEILI